MGSGYSGESEFGMTRWSRDTEDPSSGFPLFPSGSLPCIEMDFKDQFHEDLEACRRMAERLESERRE